MLDCVVLPVATGMSLHLCMSALGAGRPGAEYVIWSRIDQKSCFKSILTSSALCAVVVSGVPLIHVAGYKPVVVEQVLAGDQLTTDVSGISEAIGACGGRDKIVCIMTTTRYSHLIRPVRLLIGAAAASRPAVRMKWRPWRPYARSMTFHT